ncbi:MAG: thioredoxin-dependent thiol peroxidase [Bacteroidota bacterium]|nr:thioredoxin-dependent thiol peroxidase [Bacteroidota bacterium]
MTHLKVGDKSPSFSGLNQDSVIVTNDDFLNKKLIIFFYPKDNTPGCTAESCNLSNNYEELLGQGFDVIGVSPDSVNSHVKFKSKYNLKFNLIADVEKKMSKLFGVYGPKKFMGREYDGIHRTTFVISEGGLIEKIFSKVDTKNHAQQILESYKSE